MWYVKEADVIMESLTRIPPDVIVMSKCVPQDWHLRGVDSPFIGRSGKRDQFIEFDIAGGYTKAGTCGLTDGCNDHTLVDVIVESGRTTYGIDPWDWYAGPGAYPDMP